MLLLYRELQHSALNKPRILEFQLPEITTSPIEICTSKDTGLCCGYKPVFFGSTHNLPTHHGKRMCICTYVHTYVHITLPTCIICMYVCYVQVVGLTESEVTSVEDVLQLISVGNKARSVIHMTTHVRINSTVQLA